jgi:uncharacterized protein
VRVVEEFRGGTAEMLAPYGLIIVNYYDGGRPENRFGERAQNAIRTLYAPAKDWCFIICLLERSTDGRTTKRCRAAIGARIKDTTPLPTTSPSISKDADNPIMQGLKSPLMIKKDELFANLRWQPEGNYHVLATAYDDHSLYGVRDTQAKPGAGINEPILWTTQFGMGRVFVTALGHDPEDTENPAFKITFVRGAEWAATGKVTIPVPPELAK